MKDCKKKESCRVCGSKNLISYLNLGDMPLVNKVLSEEEAVNEKKYPLEVLLCDNCSLSQLSVVVNPEILFRNYVYRSSISDSFGKHCDNLANELNEKIIDNNQLVLDIASNDGFMLSFFKKRGNKVLGIDPAKNLAKIANKAGIETIPEFWNPELARKIKKKYGAAKIITAFNVFAHVDDMHSFVGGVKELLAEKGYFIMESPYAANLVNQAEFDTVYHEHLSYLLVKPIKKLMNEHGMRLAQVKEYDMHGGSLRYFIEKATNRDTSDGSVQKRIMEEKSKGLHTIKGYERIKEDIKRIKKDLVSTMNKLKTEGKKVCAFGASAKGNILLNYCGIDRKSIPYIFDDTPEKQGKLYPGVHIPIVSRDNFEKINPDYLLLLSWNFSKEMMDKTNCYQKRGGKYIIPIPEVRII